MGSSELIMNPDPIGISGSGLWYIQSYELANPAKADFYLMGIMIEHDKKNRLVVATKSEQIAILVQNAINRYGTGH